MEEIAVLYTTGCPKCNVLKQKLDAAGIEYREEHSVDKMLKLGITQAPMLGVYDEMYDFSAAIKFVRAKALAGSQKEKE